MKKRDDLTKEILKKVSIASKGKIKDTMSVGVVLSFFWRPNNYRLLIPFSNKGFKPTPLSKPTFPMELKWSNYNSKVTTRINGITLMRDKNSITAIWSLKEFNKKVWYKLSGNSLRDIQEHIDYKVLEIENRCMDAIKVFVKKYGGRAYFEARKWLRNEDAVHGEDYLDKISKDTIIHDTYFKKVYSDHIEFKSPTFMKNYISNRAVENIAPEIAKEISDLKGVFTKLNESINLEIYNKKLHLKVLQSMDKTLKAIRNEKRKRRIKIHEDQTRLFI